MCMCRVMQSSSDTRESPHASVWTEGEAGVMLKPPHKTEVFRAPRLGLTHVEYTCRDWGAH